MDKAWIGWVLVGTGLLDLVVAFAILGPRLAPEQRRIVLPALAAGGGLMISLGGCFLGGVF